MVKNWVLGACLVCVLLTACSASNASPAAQPPAATPEPKPAKVTRVEDLLGVWTIVTPDGGQTDWEFRADGAYTLSIHRLEQINKGSGKYGLENGDFWIQDDFCPTPGRYTVLRSGAREASSLDFAVIEDTCESRAKFLDGHQAVWAGPAS